MPQPRPPVPDLDGYPVLYIHWDQEHTSPPIGPFRTDGEARIWIREFRAYHQITRGSVHPRISWSYLRSPEGALSWVRPTSGEIENGGR